MKVAFVERLCAADHDPVITKQQAPKRTRRSTQPEIGRTKADPRSPTLLRTMAMGTIMMTRRPSISVGHRYRSCFPQALQASRPRIDDLDPPQRPAPIAANRLLASSPKPSLANALKQQRFDPISFSQIIVEEKKIGQRGGEVVDLTARLPSAAERNAASSGNTSRAVRSIAQLP